MVGEDGYQVTCDDARLRAQLARWAAPLLGTGRHANPVELRAGDPGGPAIYWRGALRQRVNHRRDLLPAFEGWVYRRLPRPVLHAAALSFRGRTALFLGESGAGKSTLALELVRRGWTYLSDEFAPLCAGGQVIAVPRPVSFARDELPTALERRLRRGARSWTARLPLPDGRVREFLYVLPARRAPSGTTHPVAAVFRLAPRPGARPRLQRLEPAAARALLFSAQVTAGIPRSPIARR